MFQCSTKAQNARCVVPKFRCCCCSPSKIKLNPHLILFSVMANKTFNPLLPLGEVFMHLCVSDMCVFFFYSSWYFVFFIQFSIIYLYFKFSRNLETYFHIYTHIYIHIIYFLLLYFVIFLYFFYIFFNVNPNI